MSTYDVIAVGGGLAGSTLGLLLAKLDLRVLILERERRFKDRVRGESMLPWGVADCQDLGIYDLLESSGGHRARYFVSNTVGKGSTVRDFLQTTPRKTGLLHFYHPQMQETVLAAAEAAGAEVRRGAVVKRVTPGESPLVVADIDGVEAASQSRLVVGADGRRSRCRKWGRFQVRHDPPRTQIAGLLMDRMGAPDDSFHIYRKLGTGESALLAPLGRGRVRCYLAQLKRAGTRTFSGHRDADAFISACRGCGVPPAWFDGAELAGPLATFEAADNWVDRPYRDGIALVGDAAGSNDPAWGCGLSLTIRDLRALVDQLTSCDDWEEAGRQYAAEHQRHFGAVHTITGWLRDLLYEVGPAADARRARALPLLAADPTRVPDLLGRGPEAPSDEPARRRLFGEDQSVA